MNFRQVRRWTLSAFTILLVLALVSSAHSTSSTFSQVRVSASQRAVAIAIARNWIVATNQYLATGESKQLMDVVSTNFVEHRPAPGMPKDVEGMQALLDVMRTQFPGLQFEARVIQVQLDVATLSVEASVAGSPLRLSANDSDSIRTWTFTERLRIEHRRVAERWGPIVPFPLTIAETSLTIRQGPFMTIGQVSRLKLSGGRLDGPGNILLLVESGEPRIRSASGVSVVAGDSLETGLPNLQTDVIARPGELIYAEHEFSIEATGAAQMVVFDKGSIYSEFTSDLYSPAESVMAARQGEEEIVRQMMILPFTWAGGQDDVTLNDIAGSKQLSVRSLSHHTLSVGTGFVLPIAEGSDLVIIQVITGDLVHNGSTVSAGDAITIKAEETNSVIIAAVPSLVETISVDAA